MDAEQPIDEKKGCIYLVTCLENGKTYVGQYAYENPNGRYTRHWAPNQKDTCIFHRALWKYGKDAFKLETLGIFPRSSLNNMEAYYAEQLKSYMWDTNEEAGIPGGYNMMLCGQMNRQGMKHTTEALAKMSACVKGRKHSEETKRKISEGNKGKKISPEASAKTAAKLRGRKLSSEMCAKLSAAQKGIKRSDEARANISAGKKGKKFSEEARANMSKARTGMKLSAEALAARKARPPTEKQIAQRKRAVEAMKKKRDEMIANGISMKHKTKKPPTEKQIAWRLKAAEIMRQRRKEKLQAEKELGGE
jgi:group I intron endonuclease